MKSVQLRPAARQDRRQQITYYAQSAGEPIAQALLDALRDAQEQMARNPGIGSPRLGQELGVEGLRTWSIKNFPLAYWYFERETEVDVVRLIGHRQDPARVEIND
ncbi:MAG: type II toxin-antitoxin system RelE/ParE family toxin [Burkholderiaceae bacterium]|nr:type II toxin-antitoxin system RelE/ParE family toxin [Burkholderiaceae bacterium]